MQTVENGACPILLTCDHAGNAIPETLAHLGLAAADREDHIAIDIGIFAVCNWLAQRLDAHLIAQAYSRLVIDCNRRPGVASSILEESDGRFVPGNQGLEPAAREQRRAEIFIPYHNTIARTLDEGRANGRASILCAMHSFTGTIGGEKRDLDIGVIYGPSSAIADPVFDALKNQTGLRVARNEPYVVDFENDYSMPEHGENRGIPYVELEIRQDLIRDDAGQRRLAAVFQNVFQAMLAELEGGKFDGRSR